MSELTISAGSRVTLHFSLALQDGSIIDSNFENSPATFVIGDGNMPPGFEQVLDGLTAGEETEVLLSCEQGFGEINPKNVQVFPSAKFSGVLDSSNEPLQPGSVVSFTDGGGHDIPGVVKQMDHETITVDFNHPLAGKEIVFSACIISVLPAQAQVLNIKAS